MNFFPGLLKAIAAGLSAAAVIVIQKVIAYFSGAQPADVSTIVWTGVSFIAILGLNYLIGKLPPQTS